MVFFSFFFFFFFLLTSVVAASNQLRSLTVMRCVCVRVRLYVCVICLLACEREGASERASKPPPSPLLLLLLLLRARRHLPEGAHCLTVTHTHSHSLTHRHSLLVFYQRLQRLWPKRQQQQRRRRRRRLNLKPGLCTLLCSALSCQSFFPSFPSMTVSESPVSPDSGGSGALRG